MAYGLTLCAALAVTFVPLTLSPLLASCVPHLNLRQIREGVCGEMTFTSCLGALTARMDSDAPVVSHAVAYQAALILMTICVPILASMVSYALPTLLFS